MTVLDSFDGLRFEEREPGSGRGGARAARRGSSRRPSGRRRACGSRTTRWPSTTSSAPECRSRTGYPRRPAVGRSTRTASCDCSGPRRTAPATRVSAVIADPTPDELRHPPRRVPRGPRIRSTPCRSPASPRSRPSESAGRAVGGRGAARAPAGLARGVRLGPPRDGLGGDAVRRGAHARAQASRVAPLRRLVDARAAAIPNALARWIVSGAPGYCQMFSASMTELLRLLGVPARVVEGFTTGTYDTRDDELRRRRSRRARVGRGVASRRRLGPVRSDARTLPAEPGVVVVSQRCGGRRGRRRRQRVRHRSGRPLRPRAARTSARSISSRASSRRRATSALRWVVAIVVALALARGRRVAPRAVRGLSAARASGPRAEVGRRVRDSPPERGDAAWR